MFENHLSSDLQDGRFCGGTYSRVNPRRARRTKPVSPETGNKIKNIGAGAYPSHISLGSSTGGFARGPARAHESAISAASGAASEGILAGGGCGAPRGTERGSAAAAGEAFPAPH